MPASRCRQRALLLALSCLAAGHAAAQFTNSVPVELVRYFSGGEIYRDLPPGFPAFEMPEGIRLMGSQDEDFRQQVLLRTTLGGAEAQQAIASALEAEGWMELVPPDQGRQTGFVVPAGTLPRGPVTLCHDDYGNLEVRGRDGSENRVYIRRYNMVPREGPSCEEQDRRRRGMAEPSVAVVERTLLNAGPANLQYLPSLHNPPGATERPQPFGMLGGPGDSFETSVGLLATELDVAGISRHYQEQLREQGWQLDAEWAGEATAGSNWTRNPEDDLRLFLTLAVLRVAEGSYEVGLAVEELE